MAKRMFFMVISFKPQKYKNFLQIKKANAAAKRMTIALFQPDLLYPVLFIHNKQGGLLGS